MNGAELAVFIPLFVALGGIEAYFLARILPLRLRRWTGTFAAAWLVAAFGLLLYADGAGMVPGQEPFTLLRVSDLGLVLGLLATGLGAVAAFASQGRIDPAGPVRLYYPLLLFALAGVVAVGFSDDLFTLFVMVELSAIPSYALVAYRYREDPRSLAAAIKYLLQGVTGTITALLGVSLLYLASSPHTLTIWTVGGSPALAQALVGADPNVTTLAAALILIGYSVKLAAVPLHTWLPDAYVRSPAGVTAILTGATKIGSLMALLYSLAALPMSGTAAPAYLGVAVLLLAAVTMTVGNLLALNQSDLRRTLAYSSVAQMGYILLAFGFGLQWDATRGFEAAVFYAVAYALMKGGAFLAADLLANAAGSAETARMRGVGARHPAVGVAFAIFILGLIGVPTTAGFLGKLLVFQAGMASETVAGVAFALLLAANSALSLGYYVPILSTLLFSGHESVHATSAAASADGGTERVPGSTAAGVVLLAAATVYLGLFPGALFGWIHNAAGLFPGGG